MNLRVLVPVLLLAAAGAAAWYFLRDDPSATPTVASGDPEAFDQNKERDPTGIETATVKEAPEPVEDVPADEVLKMPDGDKVKILNGAKGITNLGWPKDIPYAPVVEKVWHVNKWWYRHADGSYSTFFVDTAGRSWAHVANPMKGFGDEPPSGPTGPRLPGDGQN